MEEYMCFDSKVQKQNISSGCRYTLLAHVGVNLQDKSDAQDAWLVDRVNTLINDPDAPATSEIPNGNEPNPLAGVLTGNVAHREPMNNVISEELLNNTLA